MARDLIRHMQSLFLPVADISHRGRWRPPVDVYQTKDGWLVKFDLAGVNPEDVELTVSGSRLIAKGTRRDRSVAETCHCHRMEISYSQFERSVELPHNLGQTHITTEYRDGMLLVRIHQGGPA